MTAILLAGLPSSCEVSLNRLKLDDCLPVGDEHKPRGLLIQHNYHSNYSILLTNGTCIVNLTTRMKCSSLLDDNVTAETRCDTCKLVMDNYVDYAI